MSSCKTTYSHTTCGPHTLLTRDEFYKQNDRETDVGGPLTYQVNLRDSLGTYVYYTGQ